MFDTRRSTRGTRGFREFFHFLLGCMAVEIGAALLAHLATR